MIEKESAFKFSYGLFVLTARDGGKDNGCIINTAQQVTDSPLRICVTVNKTNYTHDMIKNTGCFNISILDESVPFTVFQHYGFKSGRDTDKIVADTMPRAENGIVYLSSFANAFLSGQVIDSLDCGSHTIFVAEVTEAKVLSDEKSVTYQYYFDHIKPKPRPKKEQGYVCTICGYVYEGEELPDDFICPICKHASDVFKPL